jgi:hypothetical protein
MPEWLMGADCKSADLYLRWFKSSSAQHIKFELSRIRTYIRNLEDFCPNPLDDKPL